MAKNVLYITYDGLTDPLGQSQILPYLFGLSNNGHKITIISFEKPSKYKSLKSEIKKLIDSRDIAWHPFNYTKFPPVISTIFNIYFLISKVKQLFKYQHFDIVHCRSYIAAFGGEMAQKKYNAKFIFDMRGFWADERIEGELWNIQNPIFKAIYTFFKHKELSWLTNANQIVSLTHAAKKYMVEKNGHLESKINVVPCMVDSQLFDFQKINSERSYYWKTELKIEKDAFIVGYIGSVSTWYLLDEMIAFFKIIQIKIPNALFLFISPEMEFIQMKMQTHRIDNKNFRCIEVGRNKVPELLGIFDIGLCFIKNSFSKIASSPVKLGEMMAMGIPVVCNANIGDINMISEKYNSVYLLQNLDNESYAKIVDSFLERPIVISNIIKTASEYFSLQKGIESYHNIYKNV